MGLAAAASRTEIENEYVRVIRAEVAPHERGAVHRHEFNRVIVALDAGELTIRPENGAPQVQRYKAGQVRWEPAGGLHTSENTGSSPFHLIEVEIRKPAPAHAAARNRALDPVAIDPAHNVLLFENTQVRVFRSWREAGGEEKMHEHPGPGRLAILLTPLDAQVKTADGAVSAQHAEAGDVMWSGPVTHAAKNTGSARLEMIVIEVL